ncbi:hypothetical protein PEB0122_011620 [Bartonella apis]|nr:hypothetical protein PEB0122_011620 [Bartonella apis]
MYQRKSRTRMGQFLIGGVVVAVALLIVFELLGRYAPQSMIGLFSSYNSLMTTNPTKENSKTALPVK